MVAPWKKYRLIIEHVDVCMVVMFYIHWWRNQPAVSPLNPTGPFGFRYLWDNLQNNHNLSTKFRHVTGVLSKKKCRGFYGF